MPRKTDITMLTSVGEPDLELATNSMVPMIIETMLRNEDEPTPNSIDVKLDIDVQESSNS